MKNRMIVTGLAVAADADPAVCQSCNFDTSWLYRHPSTAIWADEIVASPLIVKSVANRPSPKDEAEAQEVAHANFARAFFDVAAEVGLLAVREAKDEITDDVRALLNKQVTMDFEMLRAKPPSDYSADQESHGMFALGDYHYCHPRALSIYYSLLLAQRWEAKPLLDPNSIRYIRTVLRLREHSISPEQQIAVFSDVFAQELPQPKFRYSYRCPTCAHEDTCDSGSPRAVAQQWRDYLAIRQYDEIIEMKTQFQSVLAKANGLPPAEIREFVSTEVAELKRRLRSQMRRVFPRAERWCNIITMLSIPVAVLGVSTGSVLTQAIGAGAVGVSEATRQGMNYIASKNRWVFFRAAEGDNCGAQ